LPAKLSSSRVWPRLLGARKGGAVVGIGTVTILPSTGHHETGAGAGVGFAAELGWVRARLRAEEAAMRVQVIPMSSGEYEVQIEESADLVTNAQVQPPEGIMADLPGREPEHIVRASVEYLLERDDVEAIGPSVSLDSLWERDADFAAALRSRLA
jgi:hypothetical protein